MGVSEDVSMTELTKREWFSGMALQGLAAGMQATPNGSTLINCEAVARDAIALADALLKELNEEDDPYDS